VRCALSRPRTSGNSFSVFIACATHARQHMRYESERRGSRMRRSLRGRLARAAAPVPLPHALALPLSFRSALSGPRVSIAACMQAMRPYTRLAAWPGGWRRGCALLLHRQRVGPLRLVALELHVCVHARRSTGLQLQRVPLVRRNTPPSLLRCILSARLTAHARAGARTASCRCSSVGSSRPMPVLCTNRMGTPCTCKRSASASRCVRTALHARRNAPCAASRAASRPACPRRSAPRCCAPRQRRCSQRQSPAAPARRTARPAPAQPAPSLRAQPRVSGCVLSCAGRG
jgi:hypothetical protein